MNRKRIRRYLLTATLLLLIAMVVASWLVAGSLIAPANRTVGPPPSDLPFESLELQSESGSTLAAWEVRHPSAEVTVILLHPIRGDRRSMLGRARLIYEAGFSVFMIDLQAHGESPGENITIGYLEKFDVAAAVKHVKNVHPNDRSGIVGRSLGGAATLLASPLEVDAIVLDSVYPTVTDAVYNRIDMRLEPAKHILAPALLAQLKPRLGISTSDLRPIDFVDAVGCPILIASGSLDKHTPLIETQKIFANAIEPKQLVLFDGARHEDLLKFDREKYELEVLGFLKTHLFKNQQ